MLGAGWLVISLSAFAISLIDHLGAVGIGIGLLINTLGIPLPSEILIPLGGVAVKTGSASLLAVFTLAVAGQLIGYSLAYAAARYGGVEMVERYGKYVFFSTRELAIAQRAFDKYGGRLVLFGICLPGIHGYIAYPAGIARMHYARFITFAAIGACIWTAALMYLGYTLGDHLATIDVIFRRFAVLIVVLVVVGVVYYVRRHRQRGSRSNQ